MLFFKNTIWCKNATSLQTTLQTSQTTLVHRSGFGRSGRCSHPPASSETVNQALLQALRGSYPACGWVWIIIIHWCEPVKSMSDSIITSFTHLLFLVLLDVIGMKRVVLGDLLKQLMMFLLVLPRYVRIFLSISPAFTSPSYNPSSLFLPCCF